MTDKVKNSNEKMKKIAKDLLIERGASIEDIANIVFELQKNIYHR